MVGAYRERSQFSHVIFVIKRSTPSSLISAATLAPSSKHLGLVWVEAPRARVGDGAHLLDRLDKVGLRLVD